LESFPDEEDEEDDDDDDDELESSPLAGPGDFEDLGCWEVGVRWLLAEDSDEEELEDEELESSSESEEREMSFAAL
jgi:hypothetical protein